MLRRHFFQLLAASVGCCKTAQARSSEFDKTSNLIRTGSSFVAHETPPGTLPFKKQHASATSERKVFVDYFLPMPLSFTHVQSGDPYDQYLSIRGEGGRFADVGGYIRERPLSTPLWPKESRSKINLAIEMLRAQNAGVDGFILDVLRLPSNPSWRGFAEIFSVASMLPAPFYIVPEIDIAALSSASTDMIGAAIISMSKSSSIFRLADGRVLVTAFAPEKKPKGFWPQVIDICMLNKVPIAFLPVLLQSSAADDFVEFSYGLSSWGNRDPVALASDTFPQAAIRKAQRPLVTMQPIAPQDARPKVAAFWEALGTELFHDGWMQAIKRQVDYVHVITWNDYSEGTEVSPSSGIQYVFYDLMAYYTSYYKSGSPPMIIRDAIYYLHRRQLVEKAVFPLGQRPFSLRGRTPQQDIIEMDAFLTKPAILEIEIAGQTFRKEADTGLTIFRIPAAVGKPIFKIVRRSHPSLTLQSNWEIAAKPEYFDPLYVGGCTNRPLHL